MHEFRRHNCTLDFKDVLEKIEAPLLDHIFFSSLRNVL